MGTNSQPRIVAVATATPPNRFTQEEVLRLAGYTRPVARDIFLNSDIDYRHFYIDPATARPGEDLDTLHRRYREGAVLIARQAAERCLARAGLVPADVDCILVCSCTGYLCPDRSCDCGSNPCPERSGAACPLPAPRRGSAMPTLQR